MRRGDAGWPIGRSASPGAGWPHGAQAGVPALPNAREVSSVELLFNVFVHALIGGGGVGSKENPERLLRGLEVEPRPFIAWAASRAHTR